MLSSMASQTHVAPHADSVGREAKSEVTRIEEELEGKRFEALRPQLLEVGEVLAAPALDGLHPIEGGVRHEVGDEASSTDGVSQRAEGHRPDTARYHLAKNDYSFDYRPIVLELI